MPAGGVPAVHDDNRVVCLVQEHVGKRHPYGAASDNQIVNLEGSPAHHRPLTLGPPVPELTQTKHQNRHNRNGRFPVTRVSLSHLWRAGHVPPVICAWK